MIQLEAQLALIYHGERSNRVKRVNSKTLHELEDPGAHNPRPRSSSNLDHIKHLMLCCVLSVLPTNIKTLHKIQRVINLFLSNQKNIHWGRARKRSTLHSSWYYIRSRKARWGLKPLAKTIKACRLDLLRIYISRTHQDQPSG